MVVFRTNILFVLFLIVSHLGNAQKHLISTLQVNKNSVYVGEPVKVRIGVYTKTWFTDGITYGNVNINGAFTVFFNSKPTSKQINGVNYSGVIMTYNVFPFQKGELVFPSMIIDVETPNEGDYKGIKRKVKTKERRIIVKGIPENFDKDEWLVANNVSLREQYSKSFSGIKVGDVLERKITRTAYGTVGELIPPIVWNTLSGVSNYTATRKVISNKKENSISASAIDRVNYLFKQEGEVVLPEIICSWWSPRDKKIHVRKLDSVKVFVASNPDLGLVQTMEDSLFTNINTEIETSSKQETLLEWLKHHWKKIVVYLCIGTMLLRLLLWSLKWLFVKKELIGVIHHRYLNYLQSEKYKYKKLVWHLLFSSNVTTVNALYHWISCLGLEEPTYIYFINLFGTRSLKDQYFKNQYSLSVRNDKKFRVSLVELCRARRNYLKSKNGIIKESKGINP